MAIRTGVYAENGRAVICMSTPSVLDAGRRQTQSRAATTTGLVRNECICMYVHSLYPYVAESGRARGESMACSRREIGERAGRQRGGKGLAGD